MNRLKTVHYAFPALASLVNNTLTNLAPITIFLPENGKNFVSVEAHVTFDDIITATGGSLTTKTVALRLGAAAYTTVANANTLTNSGENASFFIAQNFTSHFAANWTGASMTCDFQLQINQSTGTTLGMVNVCVTLEITYEYDDASATQLKTVRIPLNMPTGAMATAATTHDTIPALDTYLPEASKVYRNIHAVLQGNEARTAAVTTDHTLTLRVGAASETTGNYEGSLASDRFFRYVWNLTAAYPSTAAAQTWQPTATVARCNHAQAYLVVTYEYNEAATTRVMNDLLLPMDLSSPTGASTASDYQRATREFWIQEPGAITTHRLAFFPFWGAAAALTGLNMRIGTGAFVAYTDTANAQCGSNAAMVRNDAAFTLARGRNSLNFDMYSTTFGQRAWNASGFWLVNYSSGKSSQGTGAHNHSVSISMRATGTGATTGIDLIAAFAPAIPEPNYFITALGIRIIHQSSGTTVPAGFIAQAERLAAEGGVEWEQVYSDIRQGLTEIGINLAFAQMRTLFKRFTGDADTSRMDLETPRRWQVGAPLPAVTTGSGWANASLIISYHTITFTAADTITGFSGTVDLSLHRSASGEKVMSASRSGDGPFSFTWYDNTEPLFVTADDGTNVGRSQDTLAA